MKVKVHKLSKFQLNRLKREQVVDIGAEAEAMYYGLRSVQDFDPMGYVTEDETKLLSEHDALKELNNISDLITDMLLQGASVVELVRAIRHSMVLLKAVEYKLDYKESEIGNDIAFLRKKYQ